MFPEISLKKAERKVFKTTLNDGLWDVLIGSFVLQFAVAPLLSSSLGDFWSSFIFLPFWAAIFIGISLVRKYVVTPRIGVVKFGPYRKRKLTIFTLVMLIVNIVVFIIGIYFAWTFNVKSGFLYTSFFGFAILVISSFAAYFLNFTRLFIYGLLFFLSLVVGEWLFESFRISHHGFPITFGITTGIILITGFVLFFRLLRENPIPIDESSSNESSPEEKIG